MAVSEDQQFCLRWNNFQAYITSQFETLRDDEDFVDVTLACEGQRLGAHKVVLSACSPFFKELFKTNPCPHPIIFMRDVELQHVIALLEFMYAGEVNVAQQHLPGFLKTAESLQIRGLTDASKEHTENEQYTSQTPTPVQTNQCSTTSNRGLTLKSKLYPTEPKYSPSRMVTSTQDKSREPNLTSSSPTPKKRSKTDSDENDRLTDPSELDLKHHKADDPKTNSSINPFAIVPSKSLHSEIDISSEFIEPKLELPDYSEEDTSHDESQNFMDLNETPNSFAAMTGGGDNPGTSVSAETSQESQGDKQLAEETTADAAVEIRPDASRRLRTGVRTRCGRRRSADEWLRLPLALDMTASSGATAGDMLSRIVDWRGDRDARAGGVVKLGEGIEVLEEQLRGVKWSDYRKLTRGLATILFSPVELATCSVTGQRWSRAGNGERPVKPALDRAKVQAIISYVATRFPMVEISRIKQVLAYKCKENSTAFKMKAIRYFGDQQLRPQCNRP